MLSKMKDEFEDRDVKVICVACDTKDNHRTWVKEVEELQACEVYFPIVADPDAEISRSLGLVKPKAINAMKHLRQASLVLIVDIDCRIRLIQQYSHTTGRNFYETVRAIDAMHLNLFHQVDCPANWMQGDDVFISESLSTVAASAMFPRGFNEIKPWYRPTSQPDAA
mmetsp:Transcript_47937/g.65279  ORF Transcript_47937/g.65279 Transcript_47937/m.65279 type:complete len:167 (-) Transcript_47937:431-931(-)